MQVEVKNRFAVGDRLEIIHPAGNRVVALERMENKAGEPVAVAPGNGHIMWLPLPPDCQGAYIARLL